MKPPLFAAIACVLVSLASPAHAQLATPNETGLRYGHVHLNVSNIEVHKKLWAEHFGGVLVQKGPLIAVRLPGMLVALSDQAPTGGSRGTVMDHFGFKVRHLATFLAKWRAAGRPVHSEFTGAEGLPNAYVVAPDDILVELQEDQGLPVEVAGYHIHFLTPEYEGLLDWYLEMFSLERRPRGRIETTTNVPGMNLSFGERARADRGDELPAGIGADVERAYNDFWWDYGSNITEDQRTSLVIDPPDGKIPWTPEAQDRMARLFETYFGTVAAGPEDRGLAERCILGFNSGPPMVPSAYNNNVQLFQTPDTVVILNEMVNNARLVPLDGRPHLAGDVRQWVGDSRGHWEGDTLVVETKNFLRETSFMGLEHQSPPGRAL